MRTTIEYLSSWNTHILSCSSAIETLDQDLKKTDNRSDQQEAQMHRIKDILILRLALHHRNRSEKSRQARWEIMVLEKQYIDETKTLDRNNTQ